MYTLGMVKKLLVFLLFCTLATHVIHAEEIRSFEASIEVHSSGKVTITETIDYLFTSQKRGIYRDIPYLIKNADGKEFQMNIRPLKVVDELGSAYRYTTSDENNQLRIKIGDPDLYVAGEKQYRITYEVEGGLRYFSDHDELYWNVTGNGWQVPIQKATASITLPTTISPETVKGVCYTGKVGSSNNNCTIILNKNNITIQSNTYLFAEEGLTSAVSFPKGHVDVLEPKPFERFENTWYGKIIIMVLAVSFAILAFVWYVGLPLYIPFRWYTQGRDPRSSQARAWFDAPKTVKGRSLTPAETGGLVDETVDHKDIFASLIQLAQRGYIHIEETKKNEFTLVQKKAADKVLLGFESRLLNALFSTGERVRIKDIKIASEMEEVKQKLYAQMVKEGFFNESPDKVRNRYYILAGLALVTGNILLTIVAFIFGKHMPRKTIVGAQQAAVGRALKTFISTQDRQLAFQATNQLMFEKLLPYAVAFGVEEIWAHRFKDLALHKPDWYTGYDNSAFNAGLFASSLHRSVGNFATAATPTRSTTGHSSGFSGGFSGGGGGGGGGGSW